jgi:hypothetical protein
MREIKSVLLAISLIASSNLWAMGSALKSDEYIKSFDTVDDLVKKQQGMQIVEIKKVMLNDLRFLAMTAEEERDLFDIDAALKGIVQYKQHTTVTTPRANAICTYFVQDGAVAMKMSFVQKSGFIRNEQVMTMNNEGKPELTEVGSFRYVDFAHGGANTWNPVYFDKLSCAVTVEPKI